MSVGKRRAPWDGTSFAGSLVHTTHGTRNSGVRQEGSHKQSQNSGHLYWPEEFMEAVAMKAWIVLFGNRESCLQSSLNRFHTF